MLGQNDHIFISHYHDPEDGFANLEEASEWIEDDSASQSSVVHRSIARPPYREPLFDSEVREVLAAQSDCKLTWGIACAIAQPVSQFYNN
jgi:hypothetical protein